VGRSYTLQIQLIDGKVYTSFPERVESVPAINSLSISTLKIPVEGTSEFRSGAQIIAEFSDPADQNNFYLWRNAPSTYVLQTNPELFTIRTGGDRIPAPKDCCDLCYQTEIAGNQAIFISSDDNFNGLNTRLPVGFIEDDGRRFVAVYRYDLKQIGISKEAYRFLRLVKQQTEISGSVFDPPPASIRGNMISLDNPDEVVLGYFIAGGESTRRLYIRKSDLTFNQNTVTIPDDCRVLAGPNSTAPPPGWNPNEKP
jgi:hypothetical protein